MARKQATKQDEQRQPVRSTSTETDEAQAVDGRLVATIAGVVIGLLVYLALFYRGEYAEGLARYTPLSLILVPDQLAEGWFGRPNGQVVVADRIPLIVTALGMWVTAFLAGRLILIGIRIDELLSPVEHAVFSLAIGLSCISLTTLVIGLFGGLQTVWLYVAFAAVVLVATVWLSLQRREHSGTDRPAWAFDWSWPTWGLSFSLPFVAILFLGALLPPVDFDVLEYHLQVPKQWYQQGSIGFLPHNIYGNMPLGAEVLAIPAMALLPGDQAWWWGALVGKLLIAGFAPLTAVALFAAGKRFVNTTAGVVAALVYISTPWVAVVSMNGLIDGVLGCYVFLSVYGFAIWYSAGRTPSGLVLLTGLLAGSALACKYTAALFVVLPLSVAFAWPYDGLRLRSVLLFSLAVTIAGGLWLGKNAALAGNPTYPLLYSVFGGESRTDAKDAQWKKAHQVPPDANGRRYSLSQAWNSVVDVLGRSKWQSPLLLPLMTLVFFSRTTRKKAKPWLLYAAFFLLCWWLFTHRIDRFWVPLLPVMAMLGGIGATWSTSQLWQRILWAVLGLLLIANLTLFCTPLVGRNEFFVSLQQLRADPDFSQLSSAHRFLNEQVDGDNKVLLVGDAALFDLDVPALYSTCFDECVLEQMMKGKDGPQRRAALRDAGISHVYVNWAEIRRYRSTYGFSDYVTRELIHDELVARQQVLRPVAVPNLDPANGEVFEVR